MGLFEERRELVKKAKQKSASAGKTARAVAGNVDAFVDEAWASATDPVAIASLYDQMAKRDPTVALAVARYRHVYGGDDAAMTRRALVEEGAAGVLAPLVVSDLFTDRPWGGASNLDELGDARGVGAMREAVKANTQNKDLQRMILAGIATWGSDDDRADVARKLVKGFDHLMLALAGKGHAEARAGMAAALDRWVDGWPKVVHATSSSFEEVSALIRHGGELRVAEMVPGLVRAVDTPMCARALVALAEIGDPGGAEAARRVLDDVRGPDADRVWIYHLPAQWLLSVLGTPADPTMARAALADIRPRRYGYPEPEEVLVILGCAGEVLLRHGDQRDVEQLATWATSNRIWRRRLGLAALDKLGRPRPVLAYYDPGRIAYEIERKNIAGLCEALNAPGTVYRHEIAKALAERKDPAGHAAALAWALSQVEATTNYWADDPDDADEETFGIENAAALGVIRDLAKKPALKSRIAASTSAWVRAMIDGQPMPLPEPVAITTLGAPELVVARLDQAPFVFGKQINAIALDPAGERLAVVGDSLGQIVDATTGDVVARLKLRWNWGYDCAWSPDAQLLAVAYHGGHLVVFDAETGDERLELHGFGGVPDGVKRCAWSSDGTMLAAGGSDGSARIYRWPSGEVVWSTKGQGAFEAVRWSADDAACTFSHVKLKGGQTNYLVTVDVATGKSKKSPMPSSMWCLLDLPDGRTAAGGEAAAIVVLDDKRKPSPRKLAQKKVVRIASHDGTTVVAAAQTGDLVRWDLGAKKPLATKLTTGEDAEADVLGGISGALWGLAVTDDGRIFAGGTEGVVLRFDAAGKPIEGSAGEVHLDQSRGFAPLADGTVVTSGWDGRVLRWPAEFGVATLVAQHDGRAPEITGRPDRQCAYVGVPGGVQVVPVSGDPIKIKLKKEEDVEAIACDGELLAVATDKNRVVVFRVDGLTEVWSAKLGDPSSVCFRGDGVILAGTERGAIVAFDRGDGSHEWDRDEHRDLVDKLPHGNPHRNVVGLAARGATWLSASNDDSLRLFDGETRRRCFLVDAGLFNGVAIAPGGTRAALAGGHEFHLFDVERGEHVVSVPVARFPGADELTRPCFLDDRRILVGAENGSIFMVTVA